jgi:hypothetical protein
MIRCRRAFRVAFVVFIGIALASCASSRMTNISEPAYVATPRPDQATIVFLRPSTLGFAVQSSVFDVTDNTPIFVGIVSSKKKIALSTTPGQHRFMVISEAADFMDAELAAGKTYYALVAPRFGMMKARFSLRPMPADSPDLAGYLEDTSWVDNTPASQQWAKGSLPSILEKKAQYIGEWEAKPDKPILHASDGH